MKEFDVGDFVRVITDGIFGVSHGDIVEILGSENPTYILSHGPFCKTKEIKLIKKNNNPFKKNALLIKAKIAKLLRQSPTEKGMASSFPLGAGNPGNASSRSKVQSSINGIERTINNALEVCRLNDLLKIQNQKSSLFSSGLIDSRGRDTELAINARAEKKAKQKEINGSIAEYMKRKIRPGDTVYLQGNPLVVAKVNRKTVTTEQGTKWSYDDLLLGINGRSMTPKEMMDDYLEWKKAN